MPDKRSNGELRLPVDRLYHGLARVSRRLCRIVDTTRNGSVNDRPGELTRRLLRFLLSASNQSENKYFVTSIVAQLRDSGMLPRTVIELLIA